MSLGKASNRRAKLDFFMSMASTCVWLLLFVAFVFPSEVHAQRRRRRRGIQRATYERSVPSDALRQATTRPPNFEAARTGVILSREPGELPDWITCQAQAAVGGAMRRNGLTPAPTRLLLDGPQRQCVSLDCANEAMDALQASFAVLVSLDWSSANTPSRVNVTIVGRNGTNPVTRSTPSNGRPELASASRLAFQAAWAEWRGSQPAEVRIDSDPRGARVELDQAELGFTPLRHLSAPGAHRLRISMEGRGAIERDIELASGSSQDFRVSLASSAGTSYDAATGLRTTNELEWANWVAGGALVAGGLVALISPLHTITREGECVRQDQNDLGCIEAVRYGDQSMGLTVAGAALIVIGTVVLFAQPLESHSSGQSSSGARSSLELTPNGFRLRF